MGKGVIINPSTGKPFVVTARPTSRQLRARYDAAQTGDGMIRWWSNADMLSPDAGMTPEVRRKLRMRSRYEVANNSFAKGIVLTLANYVIGKGPRLQMLLDGREDLNDFIEAEFSRWARKVRLAAKLRTMLQARTVDGEVFALLTTNPKLNTPVQLDLTIIESDQVTTPYLNPLDKNAVDGIRFDQYGNAVEYDILPEHPGSMQVTTLKPDSYPAEAVLHWFRADRPGQRRSVPEICAGLTLFGMMRRYGLAVVEAAETAANYSGVLETEMDPAGDEEDGGGDGVVPFSTEEIERNMMTALPAGTKLQQLKAEQPTGTHDQFVRTSMNEASRCINMPLNVALCDSSQSNYASGRMDYQVFYRAVGIDQDDCESSIVDRVFGEWLNEAKIVYDNLRSEAGQQLVDPDHQWFWEGYEHVDPMKEAESREVDMRIGMTSYPREYARMGLDYEQEMAKQAKALGMTIDEFRKRLADNLFAPKLPSPSKSSSDEPAGKPQKAPAARKSRAKTEPKR